MGRGGGVDIGSHISLTQKIYLVDLGYPWDPQIFWRTLVIEHPYILVSGAQISLSPPPPYSYLWERGLRHLTQIEGAQWYPSPTKISGGLCDVIREPPKTIRGWWHQSPHQNMGGGAQRYLSPTDQNIGVLNDQSPAKIFGVSMISEIHHIYFLGQWYVRSDV